MKNCPNCGALISDGQETCSVCNTQLNNVTTQNNNQNTNMSVQSPIIINSLNPEEKINSVYEPIPETRSKFIDEKMLQELEKPKLANEEKKEVIEEKKETVTEEKKEEATEETTINNASTKPTDEDKKNIMADILKEHEEKNKKVKKDDSFKAAFLSILVVIVIVVGGYFAVKYGLHKIHDGQDHIIESVVSQATDYTDIVKNYMRKYNYKTKSIDLNGYYAKSRTFNFLSIPLTTKCTFNDGKWTGADSDEVSCEKFFNDINNNYCSSVPCDVPSGADLYIKETYETMTINGNEETVATGLILDGSTLTYDDVKCSLSGGKYTCEFIEKQE